MDMELERFKDACEWMGVNYDVNDYMEYQEHCSEQAEYGYAATSAKDWLLGKYGIPY